MTKHAKLGASSAAKWLSCPGALAMESAVGAPNTGSDFAREGTVAHEIGYQCLDGDLDPMGFIGKKMSCDKSDWSIIVTEEMAEAVEVYVNYVRGLQGVNNFYEVKVDYSKYAPEGFGTADAIVETMHKIDGKRVNTLYIIDYKHGKGIRVDAFENPQGMLYGIGGLESLGIMFEHPIDRVVIVIVQPRMDNISEYTTSPSKLNAWAQSTVLPAAERAYKIAIAHGDDVSNLDPKCLVPTDKGCQWCRAKAKCKAQAKLGYEAAVKGFSALPEEKKVDLPAIGVDKGALIDACTMTPADMAAAWRAMKIFTKWAKSLDAEILDMLMRGEDIPGLKPVEGRSSRKWLAEDVAETIKALRSAGLQKKDYEVLGVISPTVAEKMLKKVKPKDHAKRYAKLAKVAIHNPAGKSSVAPLEDKRPSIAPEGFEDMTEQTDGLDFLD